MIKIVSGGQTGVDRAALDTALSMGVEVGGWCPEGRASEDGGIPEPYPLTELPGAGYPERTRQNVIDSDGTIIIYFTCPSGGTKLTIDFCIEEKKPYLLIDAEKVETAEAAKHIVDFVQENSIQVLNMAGPRASVEPRAYSYTSAVLETTLNYLSR